MSNSPVSVLLVAHDPSNNGFGRVYCLWLLAKECGFDVRVVSQNPAPPWGPLRDTEFAADLYYATDGDLPKWDDFEPTLLLPVKAWDASFGVAQRWSAKYGIPLLLDVDDPDLDAIVVGVSRTRRVVKTFLKPRLVSEAKDLWNRAKSVPTLVSNPVLQEIYGGPVIPHVRLDLGAGSVSSSFEPSIVFVGSNTTHKGLPQLRDAVARCQEFGYRLTVTDEAPPDAKSWESWIGNTSFEEGLRLVANSDVVVIPSQPGIWAGGQLPAKLIDAMILGRAIVASDVPPIKWALDGSGLLFDPSDPLDLSRKLATMVDPNLRQRLGGEARAVALAAYTPQAVAPAFSEACQAAMS